MKEIKHRPIVEILELKASKINPEVKQKWVQRLIEFDQKQKRRVRGVLKTGNCFSVLGVLCDIYLEEHDLKWEEKEVKLDPYFLRNDEMASLLKKSYCLGSSEIVPKEVREWAGLKRSDPIFETVDVGGYTRVTLAILEANPRLNFTYFADLIEKEFSQ